MEQAKTENEGKKKKEKKREARLRGETDTVKKKLMPPFTDSCHRSRLTPHASRPHHASCLMLPPVPIAYPNGKWPHQCHHRRHAHARPILILAAGCSICPAQLHCSSSTHKYLIYPFLVSFKT